MSASEPIVLAPILKGRIWGGDRLARVYAASGATVPEAPIGEAWLTSDRDGEQSVVAWGRYREMTLRERIAVDPRAVYGDVAVPSRFPLLVKWIDAAEVLSVQIHPSNEEARALAEADAGKMEAWVVLDAAPGAMLVHGLLAGTTKDAVRRALEGATLDELLRWIAVRPGDAVFVPPGTLHAIGGGLMLLEVQNNSDTTYRFFDWNRVDATGKPRALHVEKGLAVLRTAEEAGKEDVTRRREDATGTVIPKAIEWPWRGERLVRCEAFTLDRFRCNGKQSAATREMSVLSVLDGDVRLASDFGEVDLAPGAAVILPATLGGFELCGNATFCRITT